MREQHRERNRVWSVSISAICACSESKSERERHHKKSQWKGYEVSPKIVSTLFRVISSCNKGLFPLSLEAERENCSFYGRNARERSKAK